MVRLTELYTLESSGVTYELRFRTCKVLPGVQNICFYTLMVRPKRYVLEMRGSLLPSGCESQYMYHLWLGPLIRTD